MYLPAVKINYNDFERICDIGCRRICNTFFDSMNQDENIFVCDTIFEIEVLDDLEELQTSCIVNTYWKKNVCDQHGRNKFLYVNNVYLECQSLTVLGFSTHYNGFSNEKEEFSFDNEKFWYFNSITMNEILIKSIRWFPHMVANLCDWHLKATQLHWLKTLIQQHQWVYGTNAHSVM